MFAKNKRKGDTDGIQVKRRQTRNLHGVSSDEIRFCLREKIDEEILQN